MAKFEGIMKIKNNDEVITKKIIGIKTDNKIIYQEDQIMVTISLFSNRIELKRVSNEYTIFIPFENQLTTVANYDINFNGMNIKLDVHTYKIDITCHHIIIDYCISSGAWNENFTYELVINNEK